MYLDANENPLNKPYNRYPDPLQWKLKEKVSMIKNVSVDKIFFGNGSDEPIDIVIRVFANLVLTILLLLIQHTECTKYVQTSTT